VQRCTGSSMRRAREPPHTFLHRTIRGQMVRWRRRPRLLDSSLPISRHSPRGGDPRARWGGIHCRNTDHGKTGNKGGTNRAGRGGVNMQWGPGLTMPLPLSGRSNRRKCCRGVSCRSMNCQCSCRSAGGGEHFATAATHPVPLIRALGRVAHVGERAERRVVAALVALAFTVAALAALRAARRR